MDHSKYLILKDHYEQCLAAHRGDAVKEVDWETPKQANNRYCLIRDELERYRNKNGFLEPITSVLDFGCGTGEFARWVINQRNTDYTGIDISSEFILEAETKLGYFTELYSPNPYLEYNYIEFLYLDILKEPYDKHFDAVVANGVFCEKREMSGWEMLTFVKACIDKLWTLTDKVLIFNIKDSSKIAAQDRFDFLFFMSYDEVIEQLIKPLNPQGWDIKANYGCTDAMYFVYR